MWITAIECVSAAGKATPPLLIFKAKHTSTAWIPTDTPLDWHFSTSNSGWTSNSYGFEWLTTVFEPSTRPRDPSQHRLLVMDGYSSYMTANFIAYSMDKNIDLLILPPHTSHMLQPLDVSIFSPLKRALRVETDRLIALDSGRIARVEWTEAYIRARQRAFTLSNIQSGWKATGLWPLSPIEVLDKIKIPPTTTPSTILLSSVDTLDLSLLQSSPPDGTELREANALLRQQLSNSAELATPARRYTKRLTYAFESTQSENVILRKALADTQALLRKRKERKKGKRVALKGRFVFSTQEVLEVARAAEIETAKKKAKNKSSRKSKAKIVIEDNDSDIEIVSSDSDSDCITVAAVRSS